MQKSKKIIIVHGYMDMGGVEKALLALLDALEFTEFSVKLLLLRPGGKLFNDIPNWVEVEALKEYEEWSFLLSEPPLKTAIKLLREGKFSQSFRAIIRALRIKFSKQDLWHLNFKAFLNQVKNSYEADIAISFRGLDMIIPYFVSKKIRASKKLIWFHGDIKHHISPNHKFAHQLYSEFERIYGVSEDVEESIISMFPNLKDKVEVFRNIVPVDRIKKLAAQGESFNDDFSGFRLLTVGRLDPLKGQDRIPEIVKMLKDKGYNFKWYLVGDGDLENDIKEQINKLGIEDYLILLGNKMNPYPFIKNCDIYVVPSRTEGASIVMHEVKILEKPIITTSVASANLFVRDEVDGFIVSNNVEGILNGIKKLLDDPMLIQKFSFFSNLEKNNSFKDVGKLSNLLNT
ncbi:glycosyltransferase [Salegentibacter sp. BDJ18]|uniref:glycosyltransferase n=1 Tax=Salegentibacter sp. BDJ18 TaxID=2816376 RepID=UPI001AAEE874|nr:glycosyltransferase [Salegentibacter sp. BDJ18]MBO2544800.1 glycosyltransferase [Salegentibacter sp. BDJ18]